MKITLNDLIQMQRLLGFVSPFVGAALASTEEEEDDHL